MYDVLEIKQLYEKYGSIRKTSYKMGMCETLC